MGVFDKVKFWKKEEEFSDLSNLGNFGLEEKPGAPAELEGLGGGFGGGLGELPPLGGPELPGIGAPTHAEEVQPTEVSKAMGEQLGLKPSAPQPAQPTPQQQPYAAQPTYQAPQQAYPQYPQPSLGEMAKDIEIIHAKLDAIKSTLDSINQRLATIERMAGGEPRQRYNW
jgi:hypothetical protein